MQLDFDIFIKEVFLINTKLKRLEYFKLLTMFGLIIFLNYFFIQAFNLIQGYEGVINYAGVVRGASQRAVKSEFVGIDSSNIIKTIDEILQEMETGEGRRNIIYIEDAKFREDLLTIIDEWKNLKKEINNYRIYGNKQDLYMMSENFFEKTNQLVFSIQRVVEERIKFFKFFKIVFIIFTASLMALLFRKSYKYAGLLENIKSLDEIANMDKITDLPNRRSCDIQIEKYANEKELPDLLCISIDLNNLKEVNDTYGHFVGDRLISLFGKVLKEEILPYGFACRNGGDEFMVFIENCDRTMLNKLIVSIDKHIDIINKKEQIIKIDYSWGEALSSEEKDFTIYDIIELADQRMYINKRKKKIMKLQA